ncbi:MAG: ATP-binding protein [Panacagrimonas sp.]
MHKTSCLVFGARTRYRPIEAAIRWSGLLRFESRILAQIGQRQIPDSTSFPRWPMLRLYAERIFDALANDELPCSQSGLLSLAGHAPLEPPELTIRHVDLRAWMMRFYPAEKPAFLFEDTERAVHPGIGADTVQALLAEREVLRMQFADHLHVHELLRAEHEALVQTHAACLTEKNHADVPRPRSETTYLNIIGGLLTLLLGKSPGGRPYSSFQNMEAIISALLAHHAGRPGMAERTLWAKLAQARRHVEEAVH